MGMFLLSSCIVEEPVSRKKGSQDDERCVKLCLDKCAGKPNPDASICYDGCLYGCNSK